MPIELADIPHIPLPSPSTKPLDTIIPLQGSEWELLTSGLCEHYLGRNPCINRIKEHFGEVPLAIMSCSNELGLVENSDVDCDSDIDILMSEILVNLAVVCWFQVVTHDPCPIQNFNARWSLAIHILLGCTGALDESTGEWEQRRSHDDQNCNVARHKDKGAMCMHLLAMKKPYFVWYSPYTTQATGEILDVVCRTQQSPAEGVNDAV